MEDLLSKGQEHKLPTEKFQVQLGEWTGPYDLILKVIDEQELDLFDLDISKLLEHYLSYLEELKEIDIDEVGDFLVVAATLAQIKSKMLLPKDEIEQLEEEEDPREKLVRYLQEYQRIKKFADELRERPLLNRDVFAKGLSERFEGIEAEGRGTLFQLVKGFQKALARARSDEEFSVEQEEVSVAERFQEILDLLKERAELSFDDLLPSGRGKSYLIASFLAVLELVRLREVILFQRGPVEAIFLERVVEGGNR